MISKVITYVGFWVFYSRIIEMSKGEMYIGLKVVAKDNCLGTKECPKTSPLVKTYVSWWKQPNSQKNA